jgi:tetratricopeptide (TPR) repeat protein/RNA polymerase subunit RPABC4/transcription elongation factor Spt4
MNCPKCNAVVPEQARSCPHCGAELAAQVPKQTQIVVQQQVGQVAGGKMAGVEVGPVKGDLTVEATVNQVEAKIIQGDYVDRQTIIQNVLVLGPDAMDQIVRKLATLQGVDKRAVQQPGAQALPENVSRQIVEVVAAQQAAAARGIMVSPQSAYHLGLMAAYNRDYTAALEYLRQATEADPKYTDAFEAIAWLQQSLANDDLFKHNDDAAVARLAEARTAAMHTDPTDARALALRGYIAKTLAQLEEARGRPAERERYGQEATRLFEQAAKLDPADPGAQNGLGNVQHMLGNLDAAIAAYRRAIKLAPGYAAAWHDLAAACEAKMNADPAHAEKWRKAALEAWRKTYALAPDDPSFSPETIVSIGQRIGRLERQQDR